MQQWPTDDTGRVDPHAAPMPPDSRQHTDHAHDRPDPMRFQDAAFRLGLRSALASCRHGTADLAEVLATAGRLADGDPDSWLDEWMAIARSAWAQAKAADRVADRAGGLARYRVLGVVDEVWGAVPPRRARTRRHSTSWTTGTESPEDRALLQPARPAPRVASGGSGPRGPARPCRRSAEAPREPTAAGPRDRARPSRRSARRRRTGPARAPGHAATDTPAPRAGSGSARADPARAAPDRGSPAVLPAQARARGGCKGHRPRRERC